MLKPYSIVIFILLIGLSFSCKKEFTLFLAADSTVKAYGENDFPQQGWGKALESKFDSKVSIDNCARGGRSTKSFIAEGLWDGLLEKVRPGDVVMIQFGHNDHDKRKAERYTPVDEYRQNLEKMIKDVRQKKALPILVSPVAMRSFKKENYYDGHGEYPNVMRELAKELEVDLIDLNLRSGEKLKEIGFAESKDLYMNIEPGLEKNYPDGKKDNTHFSEKGAELMAGIIVGEIQKHKLSPLYRNLK